MFSKAYSLPLSVSSATVQNAHAVTIFNYTYIAHAANSASSALYPETCYSSVESACSVIRSRVSAGVCVRDMLFVIIRHTQQPCHQGLGLERCTNPWSSLSSYQGGNARRFPCCSFLSLHSLPLARWPRPPPGLEQTQALPSRAGKEECKFPLLGSLSIFIFLFCVRPLGKDTRSHR